MASKQHNEVTVENNGPEGLEVRGNISFARLGQRGPGKENSAGYLCAKTDTPLLCGWITGEAHALVPGEGKFGPYNRAVGNWHAVPFDRSGEIEGSEAFFPRIIERLIDANLKNGVIGSFALEGWVFPDITAAQGFVYRVYMRQAPGVLSAAKRMAIEAGIIPAPEGYRAAIAAPPAASPALLAAPQEGSGDPDYAEEARVKDGLDKLFEGNKAREAAE